MRLILHLIFQVEHHGAESAEDQCRMPVTRGSFDSSCGVTLLFSDSAVPSASGAVSELFAEFNCPSGLLFAGVAKDELAADEEGGAIPAPACCAVAAGFETFASGRIIILPSCAFFTFHHSPPPNTTPTTTSTNSSKIPG